MVQLAQLQGDADAGRGFLRMKQHPGDREHDRQRSLCARDDGPESRGLATGQQPPGWRRCQVGKQDRAGTDYEERTAENSCSQKTMSCMFSPPSWLASSWDQEVIGP